jgi:hypothetical protein
MPQRRKSATSEWLAITPRPKDRPSSVQTSVAALTPASKESTFSPASIPSGWGLEGYFKQSCVTLTKPGMFGQQRQVAVTMLRGPLLLHVWSILVWPAARGMSHHLS